MNQASTRLRYRAAHWPWAAAAFVLMPAFALLVRLVPGRVLRWARTPAGEHRPAALAEEQLLPIVDTVAGWQPIGRQCLPKSLTALALARLAGIPARLVIGVRRQGESLDAHAWIETRSCVAGTPVTSHREMWSA